MAMPINPEASNAVVAGSGTAATSIRSEIGHPPAMRKGGIAQCDNPRGAVGSAWTKLSHGIDIRNKVDLVDRRRGAEGRVDLRHREQDFVAVSPCSHDVLVQDIGVASRRQSRIPPAIILAIILGRCSETPLRSSHSRAQLVLPAPPRKSALPTVGRVIEIETLEFILAGRGDREIAVRPSIRRRENSLRTARACR